jgi:voltage-gated potassium channel
VAQNNFYFLFAGLLALLIVEPFLEGSPRSGTLVQLAFTSMMVVGVLGLAGNRVVFGTGIVLALIGVGTAIGFYYTESILLKLADLISIACFCILAIVVAMRQVLVHPGPITLNRIIGALCIYLLLGVLWATLYGLVELFNPGSFRNPGADSTKPLEHFIYYSFITLTTVGYGDMTPLYPVARTLAYLEGAVGQLYIAVLVAGLVGRHVSENRAGPPPS